jgi:hypothetical protein
MAKVSPGSAMSALVPMGWLVLETALNMLGLLELLETRTRRHVNRTASECRLLFLVCLTAITFLLLFRPTPLQRHFYLHEL